MYEREKELAEADFVRRFRWNNEDTVLLVPEEGREGECGLCHERPGTEVMHDYEDDVSGGLLVCWPCAAEYVHESPPREAWVSQVAQEAWTGSRQVQVAGGSGWSALWYLFAPVGRYASPMSEHPGEWPHEEV